MARSPRNYKKEYREYHAKPEQIKRRAGRNKARALMIKAGRVSKGDGKEVDHKDYNAKNNSPGNLAIKSKKANRTKQPKRS
jgi:hypothetical protein